MSKSSNKIDLKNYFETNLNKLKEFQFLKEFYEHNLSKIIKRDPDTLDKLGDKLLQIIVVFEGDYKIPEEKISFILEIIQALIDNTKIKIGYIILLNPILEYFINILNIQKTSNDNNNKINLYEKEKNLLLENLDTLLEKNFSKVKYTPYLFELIDIYNEEEKNEEKIEKFWIHSFVRGNKDILDKISQFYSVGEINLSNIKEQLEKIKEKKGINNK